MKSVAALAAVFAVGALSIPSAHNHHEHLHRRHAEADAQVYTETDVVATQTSVVMQYVDSNGNVVAAPPSSPTPAPPAAPPAGKDAVKAAAAPAAPANNQFETVVTDSSGQPVTAEAWQWGSDNGPHGYSWTYQVPGGNQQATPAPAQSPSPAPAPAPAPAPQSYSPAPKPQSSAAPASSSASAPASSGTGAPNQWQQNIVNAHNIHRSNHSVPNVQWHTGLANAAQMVANKCSFTHDLDTGKDQCGFSSYGQNFACVGGDASEDPSKDISGQWYGEEGIFAASGSYGLANPNPTSDETGHFTQVVWKASTFVGCALANCPNGVSGTSGMDSLFVCDYGPEGNMGGEYADNVPRPKGEAPSTGTSY